MTGLALRGRLTGAGAPAWFDGRVLPAGGMLLAGAMLCGVAAGVRVQTLLLTVPLLLAVLAWPGTGLSLRDRSLAVGGALLGAVVWVVPLLAASGGLGGYLAALGTQAGEDFSGVVMLWTARRHGLRSTRWSNSFVWPWGAPGRVPV